MSKRDIILLVVALVVGSALVKLIYDRGKWQERVDDLKAQVDSTDGYWLKKYAGDSTTWAARSDSLSARGDSLVLDSTRYAKRAADLEVSRGAALARLQRLETETDFTKFSQPAQQLVLGLRGALNETQLSLGTCKLRQRTAEEQRAVCTVRAADQRAQILSLEQLRGRLTAERDSALALLRPPSLFSLAFDVGVGPGCVVGLNGKSVCGLGVNLTVLKFRIPLFGGR